MISIDQNSSDDTSSDDAGNNVGVYRCSICNQTGHNKRTCPRKRPCEGESSSPKVARPSSTQVVELQNKIDELQNAYQISKDENVALHQQIREIERLQNEYALLERNLNERTENYNVLERQLQDLRDQNANILQQLLDFQSAPHHPVLLRVAKAVTCSVCGVFSGEIPDVFPENIEYVNLCCKGGHGICIECLTGNVKAATNNPEVSVMCVCEDCGKDFDEDVITKCDRDVYREYIQAKAVFDEEERRKKNPNNNQQNVNLAESAIIKTPCCNRDVCDFEDCCKVHCNFCKTSWCAWCFKVQGSMTDHDFYSHVHDCPFNPDKGRIFPTERGKRVMTQLWKARQAEQLAKTNDFELAKPRR